MSTQLDVPPLASELRLVIGSLVRRLRAEQRLPSSHVAALGRLDREGAASTSDLAARERVRPQSMATTVNDLVADGLVSRRPDPGDGRRVLLELTAAGRAAIDADRRKREGWLIATIAEQLDEDEQRALASAVPLLRRLADS